MPGKTSLHTECTENIHIVKASIYCNEDFENYMCLYTEDKCLTQILS